MKERKQKRGKKMLYIILVVIATISLIIWGIIAYLGRSQTLTVASIENLDGDLRLIHLSKPDNLQWKAGSYAKISLSNDKDSNSKNMEVVTGASRSDAKEEKGSRWLTIASTPQEEEILILTHDSGSLFKNNLTSHSEGSELKLSWLEDSLSITNSDQPLVCFASDVGIAAIRPIIKEELGKRELVLSHFSKGVMVFNNELEDSAKKHANLSYESSSSLSQSQAYLNEAVERYGNDATYLLAGQPEDVNAIKLFRKDKGIDKKRIKTSRFRGLK